MNVVIVEDEHGAAEHLTQLIQELDASLRIQARLQSVLDSVEWFNSNAPPDLGFFDIQLNDGLSFEIFQKTPIHFPVIFTTAFNQYAIDAFRVNSIDYLLKPLKRGDVQRALLKFNKVKNFSSFDYRALAREMANLKKETLHTILVAQKDKLVPVPVSEFTHFFIAHGFLHGATKDRVHALNNLTMEELTDRLDETMFFRISRQCIVRRNAVADMQLHFHSKLAVRLHSFTKEAVIVSKSRVSAFKTWLSTGGRHPLS